MSLRLGFRWGLLLLAVAALVLRWPFPEPDWRHFDESSFIVLPLGFWSGDLDPHFFNYPTFHFYLTSLIYLLYYVAGWGIGSFGSVSAFVAERYLVGGDDLLVVARGFNTLLSALTVWVVGLLGRRLHGAVAGLLAAGFLAIMPLAVRFAHLANTDVPAVLWISLALLWAVRSRQEGRTADLLLTGVFAGLAMATKYPAALVAVPIAAAWFIGPEGVDSRRAAFGATAAAVTFAVASPFVLLNAAGFWADFGDMARTHLMAESTTSHGSLMVHLTTAHYAVGWLGLAACVGGLVRAGWPPRWQDSMILAGLLAFAAPLLAANSPFMRYALPMTPLLALLMARAIATLASRRWLVVLAVPLLTAEPMYASYATRLLLSGDDTREQATRWVLERAPKGGRLLEPASECGRLTLLTPEGVFLRQAHYLRSYDVDDLLQAYRHLAAQQDLPPLFLGRADGSDAAVDPSVAGLRLNFSHPVCPKSTLSGTSAAVESAATATFSPGDLPGAGFDEVDWYFLPTAGFGQLGMTGPVIDLALSPGVHDSGQMPTAAGFFRVISWVLEAHEAAGDGLPQVALQLFGRVLEAWPRPETIVGSEVAGRLYTQIGKVYVNQNRPLEAITYLERAAALLPARPETLNMLAVACASSNQLPRAVDHWRQLVKMYPAFAPAYGNLIEALTRLGDIEQARIYQQMARELMEGGAREG